MPAGIHGVGASKNSVHMPAADLPPLSALREIILGGLARSCGRRTGLEKSFFILAVKESFI